MIKHDVETIDAIDGGYELLALSFDGSNPHFTDHAK